MAHTKHVYAWSFKNKNSWINFASVLQHVYGCKSFYTIEPELLKAIPYTYLREGLLSLGIYALHYRTQPTEWILTTDPWEKDYSNSFSYHLNEEPEFTFTDKFKRFYEYGDLTEVYRKFEELKAPLIFPIANRLFYLDTVQSNKIVNSKDFLVEDMSEGKQKVSVSVFYSPHTGVRASMSTLSCHRQDSLTNFSVPVENKVILANIRRILEPVKRHTLSFSFCFHARNINDSDYYVSDLFYFNGEDYSTKPLCDRIPITQKFCSKYKLKGPKYSKAGIADITKKFIIFRHEDSRAYADPSYVSWPRRYYKFFVMDMEELEDKYIYTLGVFNENLNEFVEFSKTFMKKTVIKFAKADRRIVAGSVIIVVAETLTEATENLKAWTIYPCRSAIHSSQLTFKNIVEQR